MQGSKEKNTKDRFKFFGGGIGGTHEDVCGALTGGVIAVGFLGDRMKPGEDITDANDLASGFRKQFIKEFGSTHCGKILERLGKQENDLKCKKMNTIGDSFFNHIKILTE